MIAWFGLPALVLSAGVATALLVAAGSTSPLRAVVAIAFLLVGPGLALVRPLRLSDRGIELTLAVVVSLALEAVIATLLLAWDWWSPGRALGIVLAATGVGVILDVRAGLGARVGGGMGLRKGGA